MSWIYAVCNRKDEGIGNKIILYIHVLNCLLSKYTKYSSKMILFFSSAFFLLFLLRYGTFSVLCLYFVLFGFRECILYTLVRHQGMEFMRTEFMFLLDYYYVEYNLLYHPDLAHIYVDYPYGQTGRAALRAAADEIELLENHNAYK